MRRNKPRRTEQRTLLTADEYRDLIQMYVDRARSDQSIAELLAGEARRRLGAEIDVPGETE
jgi:hypothetical protein